LWFQLTKSPSNAPIATGFLKPKCLINGIRLLLLKSHKRAKLAVISKKRIMFAEIQNARNHSPYTGLNLYNFFAEYDTETFRELTTKPAKHLQNRLEIIYAIFRVIRIKVRRQSSCCVHHGFGVWRSLLLLLHVSFNGFNLVFHCSRLVSSVVNSKDRLYPQYSLGV
jgi:hypothetical protein